MASFPNDHVNAASINASVLVQGGIPYQIAVLVNSTNFAAAGWNPYNATVPVSLGPTDGWYDVWIGLKGYALTSVQTWHGFRVMRDTAAPAVYITSPVGNTLSRPGLQLEGYSPEPLGSISYDLANVAGTVTGLEGYVTGQSFDTNSLSFTTNWFECLDIPLTNGANTITLHLTDLAGNVTTSVYTYTLDYSGVTSGPALTLYWPQNGGVVSGTSFTLRGLLDDPTATVAAQITDGNGVTSQGDGLVERNGLLWVENLPLGPGANTLTLSMTNAAGKSSSTSLTVIQSDVVLTIADLSNTDLNQPFIYVSGTIIGDGYTVWVNGVQATLYGGTWGAVNVPVNVGGTAAIQARAIPNTDHGGQGTGGSGGTVSTMANPGNPTSPGARDAESVPDKRPEVVEIHYDKKLWDKFAELAPNTYREVVNESIKWDLGQGGVRFWDHCWGEPIQEYFNFEDRIWDASGAGVWHSGSTVGPGACGARVENASGPCQVTAWSGEFCQVSDEYDDAGGKTSRVRSAHTKYQLRTNGKGKSHRQNLFALGAIAWGVGDYFWPEVDWDPWSYSIPVTSIAIGQFGPMESSGCLYRVLPDNRTFDVTPTVLGNPYYTFSVPDVTKYLSHFTVYVDMPGPPPSHIDHVGFDYGHAWWMLDCDASAEIVNKFTTPNRTHFLGKQVGYGRAPAWSLLNPVGELRDPEYNTNISVAKTFTIGFDGLLGGLVFTRTLHDNPGYYNVFENNCMHKVSAAGAAAGVAPALPADTKPETFGWDIYNLP